MREEILIAGTGGQGALSTGQLLAQAGLREGRHVSYVPSYGVEKRGGIASCGVTISDSEISCPIVTEPTLLVALSSSALKMHAGSVVFRGLIIINSSLVDLEVARDDVRVIRIQATREAEALGNARAANIVLAGALIGFTGIVSLENAALSLEDILPQHHYKSIPANVEAMKRGYDLGNMQAGGRKPEVG